jgi:hypothetical protein
MFWAENYKDLQYLMGTVKHHNTIESTFYGFKWAHTTAGLSDPYEADIVRSIVEASNRELNIPITADLMKLLFLKFNTVVVYLAGSNGEQPEIT